VRKAIKNTVKKATVLGTPGNEKYYIKIRELFTIKEDFLPGHV